MNLPLLLARQHAGMQGHHTPDESLIQRSYTRCVRSKGYGQMFHQTGAIDGYFQHE